MQLSPIERYAMRFVEETGGAWTADQLRAAEAEIEQQKREWEANRLATLKKEEEEAKRSEDNENELLTYSREDAQNQVNNRSKPVNRRLLNVKGMNNRRVLKRRGGSNIAGPTRNNLPNKRLKLAVTNRSKNTARTTRKVQISKPKRRRVQERITPRRLCRQSSSKPVVDEPKAATSDDDNATASTSGSEDNDESQASTAETPSTQTGIGGEEFDDSECSLDVMYDSTDAQETESNSTQVTSTSQDCDEELEDNDEEDDDDAEKDDNEEKCYNGIENAAKSIIKRRESVHNHLDINSPRTRSRGTVQLNLWTLDDSPILPDIKTNKRRSKNVSNDLSTTNSTRVTSSQIGLEQEEVLVDKEVENNASDDDDSAVDSPADVKEPQPSPMVNNLRQAKILDGFTKTPTSKSGKKTVARKLISNNGAKNNTLDKWISKSPRTHRALSPKVLLSKDAISKHFAAAATSNDNSIRITRCSSILKINAEA